MTNEPVSKPYKLDRCPFCGDNAWFSGYVVQCDSCGAQLAKQERGAAIGAWNTRLIALPPELHEALEMVLENSTYKTGVGTENCRFCDNNMDHEGTHKDMHADDCVIHEIRAAVAVAKARVEP